MHACAACPLADTAQEFLSLADSSVKHRIFIHYTGWSNDRWDSWVDARCRWHTHTPPLPPTPCPSHLDCAAAWSTSVKKLPLP